MLRAEERVSVRLVLDSSVIVAAMKPSEPGHADAVDFLERLRSARARGRAQVFAPPELWLEARVVAHRIAVRPGHAAPPSVERLLAGLDVELSPMNSVEEIDALFEQLSRHVRDKAHFANATDLAYLWVAWQRSAALITLDRGLLGYHGMVCEVMRPFHVQLP
jgi:predicted nucleic acid-binding protein